MTHFADEKPEVRAKEVMVFFCRCSARQLQWLGLSDPGFRIFGTSHTGTKGDTVPSDGFVGEIPPVEHSGIFFRPGDLSLFTSPAGPFCSPERRNVLHETHLPAPVSSS